MALLLELHNTADPGVGVEVRALVEHALSDRPGDWRVSIVGSRENDDWEMKKRGRAPAFGNRQCASEAAAGEGCAGNHRRDQKPKSQAQINEHLEHLVIFF
jgi:hypothetical protein